MTVKQTWEEGANAYIKGLRITNNPYALGTPDFLSWEAAYNETKATYRQY